MTKLDRTISREYSFKFLYYFQENNKDGLNDLTNKENLQNFLNDFNATISDKESETQLTITGVNYNYALLLIEHIINNRQELQDKITTTLTNWKFERINKIDITAIYIGACELLYVKNPPAPKIIINEAVTIAKKFGTEKSPAFVNGILDKIAHTEGKL